MGNHRHHQLHLRVLKPMTQRYRWATACPSIAPTGIETFYCVGLFRQNPNHQLHLRVLKLSFRAEIFPSSTSHQLHLRVLKHLITFSTSINSPPSIAPTGIETQNPMGKYWSGSTINCTYGYWNLRFSFRAESWPASINCTYGYWNR